MWKCIIIIIRYCQTNVQNLSLPNKLLTSTQFNTSVYNIRLFPLPPFPAQRVHTACSLAPNKWRKQLIGAHAFNWLTTQWLCEFYRLFDDCHLRGTLGWVHIRPAVFCVLQVITQTQFSVSAGQQLRKNSNVSSQMPLTGGTNCVETTVKRAASKSRTQRPILEDFGHSVRSPSVF